METKNMKFNQIVKSMITEQGRYEILKKTYTEPKGRGEDKKPPKMSKEQLDKIILTDPTTRRSGDNIKKAGAYSTWLIKQYLKLNPDREYGTPQFDKELKELQRVFFEDLYKVTDDLKKFDRFKSRLQLAQRDINTHTFDTLYNAVKDFSLEIATTTKAERKQEDHPGGKTVYDGSKWKVISIDNDGELGKEAACFYGGNHEETRWCTSSPGLTYFSGYIKQGPLYVVMDKTDENLGKVTGLPLNRYQFHFPSSQFMDKEDRQIDLVQFLNDKDDGGLKEFFKPEFMKGLTKQEGTTISVDYPRDSSSKFIALYGFEEFFESVPPNIERLDFVNNSSNEINIKIPGEISNFKNLSALHFENIIDSLPPEIGSLPRLTFLSLINNKKLKTLPDEVANLEALEVLTIKGMGSNFALSDNLKKHIDKKGIYIFGGNE